ncbi:MAG: FkbM family methyltransferase [Parachlamydiaceae bacterium]
MNTYAQAFIPYNPVIVEIGAYEGRGTEGLGRGFPYGTVYAFEPLPRAYSELVQRTQSLPNVTTFNLAVNTFNGTVHLWGDDDNASLQHFERKDKKITVPCIVLDAWCKQNGITHIDFLRLDAGGIEGRIIKSSPEILKTVSVLVTKTHLSSSKKNVTSFQSLKKALEDQGLTLLSHWYEEGKEGEAVFVRKCMYDSIFN